MSLKRIGNFKFFFSDPNKKGWGRMFIEIIHFWYVKKELPLDYFRRFLYRKEVKNYTAYLGYRQYEKLIFSKKMVFPEISSILDNKLSMHSYFSSIHLPMPKLVSYNLKNHFYFDNNVYAINNKNDLIDYFSNVFEKSPYNELFLKPLDAQGGKGIFLIKKESLEGQINKHLNNLLKTSFLHEEVIEQHPSLNKIHSKSINTLRIETCLNNKNNMEVLSVVIRFGVGNNIVDNASKGGFYVSVNLDTGLIQGVGRQDFTQGSQVYEKHPDTNIILEGIEVPFFNEACELSKKAAQYLPNRIIGWDVAITPTGPVIIEGNQTPGMDMTDVAYGGYLKHPLIKEMLNEV
ncbi:sugar-transfer associated ATP-grasp domain-containing protein [Flavivirga spongiicola]|uniref:Alpha-L-glutamate ligase-related protein ATP-grasp domain-containing protein n=1 Tax=Flavivirga spongiicola TaxID=421621 RepID=A0ABU7XYF6_9FLAO|nr:sugar-transfer associated ATP-grasp domain-containing protein [Flavivirga sp. MEBiC05379]MDO5980475.1 sugar-transfer associated ATP-grasp domain-containing protein [Flavivirga sp. MEBiC05379]